jgi:predicted ATPase
LVDLDALFADPEVRLITVVGPGGIGKTRLALEAAERQLGARSIAGEDADHRFPHGVFFVDLAALSVAEHIIPALAEALNFQLQGGVQDRRTPERQILDYLRQKRMLLIVDNFEHLLDGAELLAAVVQTASDIQVLATSRERLRLHEEQVYAIGGLEFPDWETPQDADRYSSARLFLQSARRVRHDFALHGDDLTHLSRICRLVDGMPLALILAASWADTLSLADIAAEIQRGLDFLETEWRDVPQRHRFLATIDSGRARDVRATVCLPRRLYTGGCSKSRDDRDAGARIAAHPGPSGEQVARPVRQTPRPL